MINILNPPSHRGVDRMLDDKEVKIDSVARSRLNRFRRSNTFNFQ